MKFSAPDWQRKIYIDGFAGILPAVKIDFSKLEESARQHMSPRAFAYVAGGAGRELTMKANLAAFEKVRIMPRMLCDVGDRNISIELFGRTLASPFLLSPIGVLELVHAQGDLEVSKACAASGTPFIFSNQASFPMEECASLMGDSPRWFQLYWSKSRALISSFVHRAETCGCSAIVVTLDTTMLGWRPRDLDLGYLPFLEGKGIAQYTSDPVFQKMLDDQDEDVAPRGNISLEAIQGLFTMVNRYPGRGFIKKLRSGRPLKAVRKFVATYSNPRTTWSDLQFLRDQTKLPLVLKGILHPDDARMAQDYGMDGIVVSNHGGRQVDGSIASMDALAEIVKVTNGSIPVLIDSGIRSGADAFKAIALGATAVCIGRPYAYGLAIGGKQGVSEVIRNFTSEFELTMGLAGCKSVAEIDGSFIA